MIRYSLEEIELDKQEDKRVSKGIQTEEQRLQKLSTADTILYLSRTVRTQVRLDARP